MNAECNLDNTAVSERVPTRFRVRDVKEWTECIGRVFLFEPREDIWILPGENFGLKHSWNYSSEWLEAV